MKKEEPEGYGGNVAIRKGIFFWNKPFGGGAAPTL
jgi:hypothetical protein